jgi:hypothetical protein
MSHSHHASDPRVGYKNMIKLFIVQTALARNGQQVLRIVEFASYFSKSAEVEQVWKCAIILVLSLKYGLNINYPKRCISAERVNTNLYVKRAFNGMHTRTNLNITEFYVLLTVHLDICI